MSYTQEREQFIARIVQEGLSYQAACTLLRCATSINRYAELACSSEAADRDRIPCPAATEIVKQYGSATRPPMQTRILPRKATGPCLCDMYEGKHTDIPRYRLQDHRAEERAKAAVPAGWGIVTEGDPRGYTLRVIPPSYAERNKGKDRHNLDAIGVPPRESGIRW